MTCQQQHKQQSLALYPHGYVANEKSTGTHRHHNTSCLASMKNKTRKKEAQQRRGVVTFASNARMRRTLHKNDFSEEEISSYWYNSAEMKHTRKELHDIVKMMTKKLQSEKIQQKRKEDEEEWRTSCRHSDDDGADADERKISSARQSSIEYCERGLEYCTPEGSKLCLSNRKAARDAVLDEQDRQVSEVGRRHDDVSIANIYADKCRRSHWEARKRAFLDARCIHPPSPTRLQNVGEGSSAFSSIATDLLLLPNTVHTRMLLTTTTTVTTNTLNKSTTPTCSRATTISRRQNVASNKQLILK